MSFVGVPFKHDVFLSYSHGDVRGDGVALLKQWSQGLVRELELELQAYPDIGAQIRVFLDENFRIGQGLDPMAPLTDQLKDEVAKSAILALLVSPQYLGSHWCRQEREWWIEAQKRAGHAHETRIAVARIWPTEDNHWPADLLDCGGHQRVGPIFYDRPMAELRPQPFSWPTVDQLPGPFRDALLDFVGHLRRRLLDLRRDLEQRRAADEDQQRLSMPAGQVLYLYGRESHATYWRRVNRELEEEGFIVFPEEPETIDSDPKRMRAAQAERIRTMSASDAILVVGTQDAAALAADLMVVGRLDRHQAVAHCGRSLPCGVIDTAGVVQQNPLLPRKAKLLGIDWFDASVAPWARELRGWLNGAVG